MDSMNKPRWFRRRTRALLICGVTAAMAPLAGTGVYLGALQLTGNFHTVIPNEVFRSAQPSPSDIRSHHAVHGIKTIINLRGENPDRAWYREEVAEARRLNLTLVNFPMSAKVQLTQEQAVVLVTILKNVPKPILIHCNAGADRSGLVSALYVAAIAKLGEEAAESQISLRYGHLSVPLSATYAMDASFEELEPWLGFGPT